MASASVNRPTNVQQKEQDVNNKLQLFGIYSAFANGKVPSNRQVDVALNSALASSALSSPSSKLSSEGQHLVEDLRVVIEKAKVLLLTKNEGNLLQDFIWQTQQISGGNASLPDAPVDKATAKQHGSQAVEGLRTLGTLILSNGQFRKLLSDATIILRDMAGDAAQSVATRVNPSQDRMAQIDRPADDNTWHDVPDLSAGNLKAQAKQALNKNTPLSKQDVKDASADTTQTAHPDGSRDPRDAADVAVRDGQNGTKPGLDVTGGLQAGASSLANKIPDEHKERAKDVARNTNAQTKSYLASKMPPERRDQTIWRLKKMVVEIQGHPDYQQAVETLLSLAETYGGHSRTLAQHGAGTVKDVHADDALTTAEADLKTLIERFANYTSTDDLFESINNIYRDADRDPELQNWFKHVDGHVRKCLQQQGYILEDAATSEWNKIYDQGEYLLRDRYRDHTDRILDEFGFLADQFNQDPLNRSFADAMQQLFDDLGTDETGKPTFKTHLVKDLVNVILPAAFENVRYVPLPRIEYSDPTIDCIVENLVVESDNLMPNMVEIDSDNKFVWGRKTVASSNKNKALVAVSGVQMDLKDVSYYIKKKAGFPSLTDIGIMDVFLGGSGFSFTLGLETVDKSDKQTFFKVGHVKVDLKNLRVKVKQSKHKLVFNLFKPVLMAVVKPALTKVLEKQIRDSFAQADSFLFSIYQEGQRATQQARQNPDQAQNVYQTYLSAFQRRLAEGKQKTASVGSDKHANVAVTQHDSMFKDIKLPGGIGTKATEYKELAAEGDKWESPVFGIGSAAETTDLPKASPVTRKAHQTASGTVRGRQNPDGNQATHSGPADLQPEYHDNNRSGSGFGNQVSQAFDTNQDLSLQNGSNGYNKGASPLSRDNAVVSGNA